MKKYGGTAAPKKKKSNFLKSFVCIFLGILLIFGIVMGTIAIVNNAKTMVHGGGVTMEEGVVNYFASQFKVTYIASMKADGVKGADDKSEFWEKEHKSGVTYGEHFKSQLKVYLSEIVSANIIFDNYGSLDGGDEGIIDRTVSSVLQWKADNSVDRFNEISAKYGFNYDDFCKAAKLLYKAQKAQTIIYGDGGINLDSSLAEEYYENYTHVSLAFIRTDYIVSTDPTTGKTVYDYMDTVELAKRNAKIAEIKGYIDNITTGEGDVMTAATFRELVDEYEGDSGVEFYFYEGSAATREFAVDFENIVNKSYEMENGEFAYVECNVPATDSYQGFVAVCFIYKTEDNTMPYLDEENTFFSDFFVNAADYFFSQNLKDFSSDVEFTDRYNEKIDPLSIPKNNQITIESWVK